MTAEDLDLAAFGPPSSPGVDPDLSRAIERCYLPMREAGYGLTESRLATAGFLGAAWGMRRVADEAQVLLAACTTAEDRLGRAESGSEKGGGQP